MVNTNLLRHFLSFSGLSVGRQVGMGAFAHVVFIDALLKVFGEACVVFVRVLKGLENVNVVELHPTSMSVSW